MTEIKFKDTAIPATSRVGRKALPNPFVEVFPLDDGAKTFTIPEDKDSTEAKRIVRQVRAAAKQVKRTGRVDMQPVEGGKGTQVTIWTTAPVVRKAAAKK